MSLMNNPVKPPCPHFGVCGGCTQQHLSASDYETLKWGFVRHALAHVGLQDVTVEPPIIFPSHSRRRCNLKALRLNNNVLLGYHEHRSHNIVNASVCPLVMAEIEALFDPLRACLLSVLKPKQKADLFLALGNEGIDLIFTIEGLRSLEFEQTQALTDFATRYGLARIANKHRGELDPVVTFRQPTINYGDVPVEMVADGFMQASQLSDDVLTDFVLNTVPPSTKRAADLFCGRGTYGLPLSQQAKVDAYDLDGPAIAALERAKNKYQRPVQTHVRNLFEDPLSPKELAIYDFVVINPPRAGAFQQCKQLAESRVPVIAMVSCDPKTFARDANVLINGGYRLERVTPVDQFLWSNHVEVMGKFERS